MRRTKKPKGPKSKLLVSVERVRSLEAEQLRAVLGGACPKSRPLVKV